MSEYPLSSKSRRNWTSDFIQTLPFGLTEMGAPVGFAQFSYRMHDGTSDSPKSEGQMKPTADSQLLAPEYLRGINLPVKSDHPIAMRCKRSTSRTR